MIDNFDFKEMNPQKYWAPPSTWSQDKKKNEITSRIFSGDFLGSEKKDGYFTKIVKENGEVFMFSRSRGVNGEFPEKHEWVPHLNAFFDALPDGTCVLGELYLRSTPGSSNITKILGCLKDKAIARQEKEKLVLYIFDVLAYDGKSLMTKGFQDRIKYLENLKEICSLSEVEFAEYYEGNELWEKMGEILAAGGEGVVITRKESKYQPDKRPSKDCAKVKKEISETIDCFFTGRASAPTREYTGKELETWQYWFDEKTGEKIQGELYRDYMKGRSVTPLTKNFFFNFAGSLEIGLVKENQIVPIGYISGVTEEMRKNFRELKGKVIEVTCMEITKNQDGGNGLRHAKIVQFRDDKKWQDCKWEDVFEK